MKKTEKLTTLKARLWRLVSEYVRKSACNHEGYIRCVTCKKMKEYSQIDAGHFLPKKKGSAVYFDLRNIHAQCTSCNRFQHGNIHAYYDFMLEKYGLEVIEELKEIAAKPLKLTRSDYYEMIEDFKQKLSQLE